MIPISLHIEFTDKCQAACPMCPRNLYGGIEDDCVKNVEITIEQFKTWFPHSVLEKIDRIFPCGNLGDPLLNRDSLKIFEYIKSVKPEILIRTYTNGSLQTDDYWNKFISLMDHKDEIVFAIDGFSDTHSIYRRNTNWDRVIENAKKVISAGKRAKAEILVFEHNEHQIDDLTKFLYDLGFVDVWARSTHRFYGFDRSPVMNRKGEVEYYLKPAKGERWSKKLNVDFVKLLNKTELTERLKEVNIDSKCSTGQSIYVNTHGHVYPCCWVGSTMDSSKNSLRHPSPEGIFMWDRFHDSAREIVSDIGRIELKDKDIFTAIKESKWDTHLEKHYTTEPKLKCAVNCGTNFFEVLNKYYGKD